MTDEEIRRIAVEQNDQDYAAGRLPSRYIEDDLVLAKVARLMLADTLVDREPSAIPSPRTVAS